MSCFVMSHEDLAKIALFTADVLSTANLSSDGLFGPDVNHRDIPRAFRHLGAYIPTAQRFSDERIFRMLYRLNVAAAEGVNYDDMGKIPSPDFPQEVKPLHRPALRGCCPPEWSYRMAGLLDCYLYQTNEDTTMDSPIYIAMDELRQALFDYIVRNYEGYKW